MIDKKYGNEILRRNVSANTINNTKNTNKTLIGQPLCIFELSSNPYTNNKLRRLERFLKNYEILWL